MKPIGPIPKKVKCISQKDQPSTFKVGGEYTVNGDGYIRFESDAESGVVWNSKSGNSKFQPIYTDEELLEYAKKMYPEGTEFFNSKGEYRKSEGVNYLINRYDGCIDVQAFAKDGTRLAPDIYSPATGWAEIIGPSEDSVKQTYMFKEGDPVISNSHIGVTGFTICGFNEKDGMYLICSPTWNEGHNGSGVIPVWGKVPDTSDNSCWWVHEDSIILDNQTKEKNIDTFIINVGDYIKIIDRPTDGSMPMGYLYGTWQEVLGFDSDGYCKIYSDKGAQGVWHIHQSNITEVRSYNPDMYISGCDTSVPASVTIKGGNATSLRVVDDVITVDVAPSKPVVSHLGDSVIVTKEMVASEIKNVYGEGGIYDDFVNHLAHLGKDKSDLLPVPSLRVSRKNIKK